MSAGAAQNRSAWGEFARAWGFGFALTLPPVYLLLAWWVTDPTDRWLRAQAIMMERFGRLWWLTADPILNLLIDVALLVGCWYIVIGTARVTYYGMLVFGGVLSAGIALALTAYVWLILRTIAGISPTGALVAVLLVVVPLAVLVRKHHLKIAGAVARVVPSGSRADTGSRFMERGTATKVAEEGSLSQAKKEPEVEVIRASLETLHSQVPSTAPVPDNPLRFGGWINEAVRRLQMESVRETVEKHAELVATARRLEEEVAKYYRAKDDRQDAQADSRARRATESERERLAEETARENLAAIRADARAKRLEAEVRAEKARQDLGSLQNPPAKESPQPRPRESRAELERQLLEEEAALGGDLSPMQREIRQARLNELADRLRRMG